MAKRRRMRRFLENRVAVAGTICVALVLLLGALAPLVATHGPNEMTPVERLQSPSRTHLFGTDHLGRDVFSRIVFGARTSIGVGLSVVLLAGLSGAALGILSGYYRTLDSVLMRLMDGFMAFPGILLAIGLMAALGPSVLNVVIALAIVYTPRIARIARATVLVLREQTYVEAAKALGGGDGRLLVKHIAPNSLAAVNVQVTFVFAYAIFAEAALSFLGVGAPPEVASWGNILSEGRPFIARAPWMTLYPGVVIMLTVLGLNLLGDGLRDYLDPRLRGVS